MKTFFWKILIGGEIIATTLRDIADKTGVSLSTVHRVLSGKISLENESALKVLRAADELGYTYQEKNTKRRNITIGVVGNKNVEQSTSNSYFSEVLRGISTILNLNDANVLIILNQQEELELAQCEKMIENGEVDGFILLSSRVNDSLVDMLSKKHIPFVVIGRTENPQIYSVNTDTKRAFEDLTEHLIKIGHSRISLLNGSMKFMFDFDVLEGYKNALSNNNIDYESALVFNGGMTWQESYEAALRILSLRPIPTAIVAADDIRAISAMKAIHEYGLRVPKDIAVVSYSDHDIASLSEPSLTTIRVPIFELGSTAAKSLLQILNGETIETMQHVETQLVIRESCGFKSFMKDQFNK